MTTDEKIATIIAGRPNSLCFDFNEHWCDYQTIEGALEDLSEDDFVSRDDIQKCIDSNSLWQARWYSHTPVGFFVAYGSTLEIVLDSLLAIFKQEFSDVD